MNYTEPKYYQLEPYHNPDNVDESKVPKGWRMRYKSEAGKTTYKSCTAFIKGSIGPFPKSKDWLGDCLDITYIVPVNEA